MLNSHPPLQSVKEHLAKIQNIVSAGGTGPVDIETLPIRITDLLSKTQVNISSSSGIRLPLERHFTLAQLRRLVSPFCFRTAKLFPHFVSGVGESTTTCTKCSSNSQSSLTKMDIASIRTLT